MKVWIVDDDPAYTYLLRVLITSSGAPIEIRTFSDGELAYDYLASHISDRSALPDVIFLDINMPGMDGWDFMEAYNPVAPQSAAPIEIYILSSSISDGDISRADREQLVTDFITKPLEEPKFAEIYNAFQSRKV